MGKSTRRQFYKVGTEATEVLGEISADLSGKFVVPSRKVNQYALLLIDKFSRMKFIYFVKQKSEIAACYKSFARMRETHIGRKIKVFKYDAGSEFATKVIKKFLDSEGTILRESHFRTPEENGDPERYFRTLGNLASAMLEESGLSQELWEDALAYVNHTLHRLPPKTPRGYIVPYKIWTGQKPNVSYMRPFGCEAILNMPKLRRQYKKIHPKGKIGVLIGYDRTHNGYKIYFPDTGAVDSSRDVEFNEETFPFAEAREEYRYRSMMDDLSDEVAHYVKSEDYWEQLKANGVYFVETETPRNFKEAMSSSEGSEWKEACDLEYQALMENETWEITELLKDAPLLKSGWVFRRKTDETGTETKKKARFVAKGYSQIFDKSY